MQLQAITARGLSPWSGGQTGSEERALREDSEAPFLPSSLDRIALACVFYILTTLGL